MLLQHLPKCVLQIFIGKNDMNIFKRAVILRHGGIIKRQFFHSMVWQINLRQDLRYLTAPVSSKIETDYYVVIFYIRNGFLCFIQDHGGLDKFVGNIFFVGILNGFSSICSFFTFTVHQSIISQLNPFPTFVPVHRVIPAADTGDFSNSFVQMRLQIFYEAQSAFWIRISSVCKSMDKNILEVFMPADVNNCFYVVDV